MKRNLISAVSFLAAASVAGFASAGGYAPAVVEPVITPVQTYVPAGRDWTGGYAGLSFGRHEADMTIETEGGEVGGSVDDTGLGAFVGYLYDMGDYVVGGELSYDTADFDGTDGDLIRLRGRLGYDAGNWMPYATLGMAHAKLSAGGESASDTGITFGLGAEFALTENFRLGAEIGRSSFSDFDGSGVDLDVDTIQIRASFAF